jgi:hypothetical protein
VPVTWKVALAFAVSSVPAGGGLFGISATSARNAWAVGDNLILHWNGKAWTRQPVPAGSYLSRVAAVSARDAWAVGFNSRGSLILRWNGVLWKPRAQHALRAWPPPRPATPGRSAIP